MSADHTTAGGEATETEQKHFQQETPGDSNNTRQ